MMKKILCVAFLFLLSVTESWAVGLWERQGNFYFLTKNTREYFSANAAGLNKFPSKYMNYDGVDFLVRGADDWKDYGRLNLDGNNLFTVPIPLGTKVDELHFLAGGNFGNSYKHDSLLSLYGDNYYYGVINVLFVYKDSTYKSLSVPIFWDWFHLGSGEWSKDGARIKSVGNNPVRKDCSMYHIAFDNPQPSKPLQNILVSDSWVEDIPFSDIFALTLKSGDSFDSVPKENKQFKPSINTAVNQPADTKTEWPLDDGLDGWIAGNSENWDVDASWQAESYEKKGAAVIPACNWAGDKYSWIEKKVVLPSWDGIQLRFLRHSAIYSSSEKQWSDGLLKVFVQTTSGQEKVYEKLYSGEWNLETIDLTRYKGQTVIIRFENHGGGQVRLSQSSSPACDGEDAIIKEISLLKI